MIWLQTSTYSCEPTPQSPAPYNHSLAQKFIVIIRDWWYPEKNHTHGPRAARPKLTVSSGWLVSISVCDTERSCMSCFMDGAELRHPFSCPEGTRGHYQPWQPPHSKRWGGKGLFSICQGTSKVLWHLEIGFTVGEHLWLLSVPFTRLSNTYCHCRYFSRDVLQKESCSSSKDSLQTVSQGG